MSDLEPRESYIAQAARAARDREEQRLLADPPPLLVERVDAWWTALSPVQRVAAYASTSGWPTPVPAHDHEGNPGALGRCPTCSGSGVAFTRLVPPSDALTPGATVTDPTQPHAYVADDSSSFAGCVLDGRSEDDVVHEPGWPSSTAGMTREERRAQGAADRAAARAPRPDHPNPRREHPADRRPDTYLGGGR